MLGGIERGFACLFNLLYPDDCAVCQTALTSASRIPVCAQCLANVQPLVAEFACAQCRAPFLNEHALQPDGICPLCRAGATQYQAAYSFGSYDGGLIRLIHLYKYAGVRTLAAPFADWLAAALPRLERFDAIVPVPLHWWKKITRGFDQSELLAIELSKRTGIPVARWLSRTRITSSQAGLTSSQRRTNVAGAFRASQPQRIAGARVLLLDDVLTTGTTLSAAAGTLRRAGAARVTALTVARADRRAPARLWTGAPTLKANFAQGGV